MHAGEATATCCTFDVVGKLLAVGNVLGRCILYNLETAEKLVELRGNASPLTSVVFSQVRIYTLQEDVRPSRGMYFTVLSRCCGWI